MDVPVTACCATRVISRQGVYKHRNKLNYEEILYGYF
jgi:hypothetical protein